MTHSIASVIEGIKPWEGNETDERIYAVAGWKNRLNVATRRKVA